MTFKSIDEAFDSIMQTKYDRDEIDGWIDSLAKRQEDELKRLQSLPKTRFIVGKDKFSFKTTSWCYDTCGNMTVSWDCVAKDDIYVYFWNLAPVKYHNTEESGNNADYPFIMVPLVYDNSNCCLLSDCIIPDEDAWPTIKEFLYNNAILSDETKRELLKCKK